MTENTLNQSIDTDVSLKQIQNEMRKGHANGSIGIVVSGFIWLFSAIIAFQFSAKQAVWTLLIGGALIHPISTVIEKLLGLNSNSKNNQLKNLAMESTIWMLMCIPLAFGLSLQNVEWFFQGMLLIIGGRYLTFATVFGDKRFWILGAFLGIAAYLLYSVKAQSFTVLLTGSMIEILFGLFMFFSFRQESKENA